MKKNAVILICLLILAAGLASVLYFGRSRPAGARDRIEVVVSIPLLKYMADQIGGEEVQVYCIIKGAACSHTYEPTMRDMKQIAGCALAIKAGFGFDTWFEELAASAKRAVVVDAAAGVEAMQDEDAHEHGEEHDEAQGHHHEPVNPHYWGDPDNAKLMAANIAAGLSKVRPAKQQDFERNYRALVAEIDKAAGELRAGVAKLADRRIVSYSAAFPYFFAYFGLDNRATVETTCEQEVSPKRLLEVSKLVREEGIKVIVGDRTYPKLPENLAKETGARLVLLWPATDESGDYLRTMRENVTMLLEALK